MKTVDEIDIAELKKVCKRLNETGFVNNKIKYVGVKAADCLAAFVGAIDILPPEKQVALPSSVIDFYNDLIMDEVVVEDELAEVDEQFLEEDLVAADPEDDEAFVFNEEAPEEALEEALEESPEEVLEEAPEEVLEEAPEEVLEEAPEEVLEEALEEAPEEVIVLTAPLKVKQSARPRKTSMVMKPSIETIDSHSFLKVSFPEKNLHKQFKLPIVGDRVQLKLMRKEAFEWATAHGATQGQIDHISKTLNDAGHYVAGKR